MKLRILILISLGLAGGSGCEKSGPNNVPDIAQTLTSEQNNAYHLVKSQNTDGSVVVTTKELVSGNEEWIRQEVAKTSLETVPIGPQYNSTFYSRVGDPFKSVYVAPKIFAYTHSEGASSTPIQNEDGTMTILFHVALIDGLSESIQDPSTLRNIIIPSQFLVVHLVDLNSEVSRLGYERIASLAGCPSRISIRMADRTFDVTPVNLSLSDYCELNRPFVVSLRLQRALAEKLLSEELYDSTVSIEALYKTMATYLVSEVTVQFDRAKIFKELEGIFSYQSIYTDAEVRLHLREILEKDLMTVHIQGEISAQVESMITNAQKIFFEEYRSDPEKPGLSCTTPRTCFKLSISSMKESKYFSVNWSQNSNVMTGQSIYSTAKLHPLNDKIVVIGDVESGHGSAIHFDHQKREIAYNDEEAIEVGMTVDSGDILEITPAFLTFQSYEPPLESIVRTDHFVCVEKKPKRCPPKSVDECFGDICVKSENHWIDTISYLGPQRGIEIQKNEPVGQYPLLFDGLELEFKFFSELSLNQRTVICPVKNMLRLADGLSLRIKLVNQDGCQIFSKDQKNKPMLYLKNRIIMKTAYPIGALRTDWQGKNVERPISQDFYSRIGFGGILQLKSLGFSTF